MALLFAGGMNFANYWWSDKIVLRMYNAQEVSETEAPELYRMIVDLVQRANMPMPRVLYSEQTPNAFAAGRNPENAAVAVTVGLMEMPAAGLAVDGPRAGPRQEPGHTYHDRLCLTGRCDWIPGADGDIYRNICIAFRG
jgi:hypothetical protein